MIDTCDLESFVTTRFDQALHPAKGYPGAGRSPPRWSVRSARLRRSSVREIAAWRKLGDRDAPMAVARVSKSRWR